MEFVLKVHVKDNGAPDPDHGDLDGGVFFFVDFIVVPVGGKALSTEDTLQFLCEKLSVQSNGVFEPPHFETHWRERLG